MRLINHGFNTTYRVVDQRCTPFALRINIGSFSKVGQLSSEAEWVSAIDTDGVAPVAKSQTTKSGAKVARVPGPQGRDVDALLYSWLPGQLAYIAPTPDILLQLGEITFRLHEHARSWAIPEGVEFARFKNHLYGYDWVIDPPNIVVEHLEKANAVLEMAKKIEQIPIHFDLHLRNVMVHRGKIAIIDFDDCLITTPAMDPAISLFYLRSNPNAEELEAAYWEGLGKTWEDFGLTKDEFELLVVGRAIFMINELARMSNARMRDIASRFRRAAVIWLEHFATTGTFDPRVARLQDLPAPA